MDIWCLLLAIKALIMHTYITVAPNDQAPCGVCNEPFQTDQLRVTSHRYRGGACQVSHLPCFHPLSIAPIRIDDFELIGVTSQPHLEAIETWTYTWNLQFEVDEGQIPEKYLRKGVESNETPLRRTLLTVYEYLSVVEIETLAACVCRAWYHITRDQELWKLRFIREFNPVETELDGEYRRKYMAFERNRCWHCHRIPIVNEVKRKCKLEGKPLCVPCSRLRECRVVTLHSFSKQRNVPLKTLERLQVPYFEYYSGKSCYLHLIIERVLPHAEHRRSLLLQLLRTQYTDMKEEDLEMMAQFPLNEYYKYELIQPPTQIEQLLVLFCGKNGVKEILTKTVDRLYQSPSALNNDHPHPYLSV